MKKFAALTIDQMEQVNGGAYESKYTREEEARVKAIVDTLAEVKAGNVVLPKDEVQKLVDEFFEISVRIAERNAA